MVPVLAGFIAFSIADRREPDAGLIGGMLAVSTGAEFHGGIIAVSWRVMSPGRSSNKLRCRKYGSAEAHRRSFADGQLITSLIMIYVVSAGGEIMESRRRLRSLTPPTPCCWGRSWAA